MFGKSFLKVENKKPYLKLEFHPKSRDRCLTLIAFGTMPKDARMWTPGRNSVMILRLLITNSFTLLQIREALKQLLSDLHLSEIYVRR